MTLDKLKQIHKNNIQLERLAMKYEEFKMDYGMNGKEVDGMP